VPEATGKPVGRLQPLGVETVAEFDLLSVTQSKRSPDCREAGAVGVRLVGFATLFAVNEDVPAARKVGFATRRLWG